VKRLVCLRFIGRNAIPNGIAVPASVALGIASARNATLPETLSTATCDALATASTRNDPLSAASPRAVVVRR
jgi:hypothetical protein